MNIKDRCGGGVRGRGRARHTTQLCASSAAEQDCYYSRIAAAMQHGDDDERLFIWSVSNHIISQGLKAQRPSGEVWAVMACVRKCGKGLDCFVNFFENA